MAIVVQQLKAFARRFCVFNKRGFVLVEDFFADFIPYFNENNFRYRLAVPERFVCPQIYDTFIIKTCGLLNVAEITKQIKGVHYRNDSDVADGGTRFIGHGEIFTGIVWKEDTPRDKIYQQQRAAVASLLSRFEGDHEGILLGLLHDFVIEHAENGWQFRCFCRQHSNARIDGYDFYRAFREYAWHRLYELYGYEVLLLETEPDTFHIESFFVQSREYDLEPIKISFLDLCKKLDSIKIIPHCKSYNDFQYVGSQE